MRDTEVNNEVDLVYLNILNEPELLFNLKKRFLANNIFTYIGPTLVIINPYSVLETYYNNALIENFYNNLTTNINKSLPEPHTYAICT